MPVVQSVRVGQHPDHTRFVMEVSDNVSFKITTLADPYRVVVDFPELGWQLPEGFNPRMYGALSGFRYGLFKTGTSRIVLDANAPVKIKQTLMLPPRGQVRTWRFVMDLIPTDHSTFMALMNPAVYPDQVASTPTATVVENSAHVQQARVPAVYPIQAREEKQTCGGY